MRAEDHIIAVAGSTSHKTRKRMLLGWERCLHRRTIGTAATVVVGPLPAMVLDWWESRKTLHMPAISVCSGDFTFTF